MGARGDGRDCRGLVRDRARALRRALPLEATATCTDLLAIAGEAFSIDVGIAAIATAAKNVVIK